MEISIGFPPNYAFLLIVGFTISILLWILRYYIHVLLGAQEEMQMERLKGQLMDNVVVVLLAIVLTISLSYLGEVDWGTLSPYIQVEDGKLSLSAMEVVERDVAELSKRVETLMKVKEAEAKSNAFMAGFSLNILSLPIYVASESRYAELYAQASALYQLLYNLSVVLKVTKYLFQYFNFYAPFLILLGAVVRTYPGIRAFGGFLMALGIAMAIYPYVFLLLFQSPVIPSTAAVPEVTFCDFKGFSPITFSVGGSPALTLLMASGIGSSVADVVRELYITYLLKHIVSLGVSLQVLRIASIVLSGQTLLTSAFESRVLAHV